MQEEIKTIQFIRSAVGDFLLAERNAGLSWEYSLCMHYRILL